MFAKFSKQGRNKVQTKNVGEVPNDVNNSFTANNWQLGKFRMDAEYSYPASTWQEGPLHYWVSTT